MANRYWVGGSGTWDASTTTNWSATSGGAGGASAPTSADDVFFDSSSGASPTVTIGSNAVCGAVTITAPTSGTLTFAFSTTGKIQYNGNWSSPASLFATTGAGANATSTGAISYVGSGSSTLTTNGYSFPTNFGVNTSTGTLTLGSALTTTSNFNINQGTFSTSASNYNLSAVNLFSNNSNTRTISLNGSTVTFSGDLSIQTATNLTFNAGTSTINFSGSAPNLNGSGQTFSTVAFTGTGATTIAIIGANTFLNLTFTTKSTSGINLCTFGANQTISGTLTLGAANTSVKRLFFASDTIGTARTLTVATIATLSDVDFRDITAAGASGTWSGTRLGNCQGNSNITFVAGKTVYWNLAGAQSFQATAWATSSGGTPAANNFPLAQDTAVFDNTGSVTGTISTGGDWNIGTLDMSARTNAMTLNTNGSITIYGSWSSGTGITMSGTLALTFAGRSPTQQITSNGIAFTQPITVDNVTGTVQLVDNFTTGTTRTFTLTSGTLDLNGKTLSTGLFTSSNSNTRTIAFGSGNITCTGTGTVWTTATVTGLIVTGTPVVNVTSSGSTAITVNSGAISEASSISFNFTGGTYALTFLATASYSAKNVDFTGFAGTWNATASTTIYGNLKLSTGMTLTPSTGVMTFGATSGTQTITSNGKTMDFPITINGNSATTVTCADALTLGSTRALTFALGTLKLAASVTSTVGSFVTSGSTLKYLQSTTSGTQATLSDASGTNTVTYLSIQDSNATGGATFTATSATNVNAGNNTGWDFGVVPSNFFLMFN